MIYLPFYRKTPAFKTKIQIFHHNNCIVFNHQFCNFVNNGRKIAFFKFLDVADCLPVFACFIAVAFFLDKFFMIIHRNYFVVADLLHKIQRFLQFDFTSLIDKRKVNQMTLATVKPDNFHIRIFTKIVQHFLIELSACNFRCFEIHRNWTMEQICILCKMLVFYKIESCFFIDNRSAVKPFLCFIGKGCNFAVFELIDFLINFFWNRFPVHRSSVDKDRAFFVSDFF